jgi:hypothetical protein
VRMTIAGAGTGRLTQFNPKNVSLIDYQVPSTTLRCWRRILRIRSSSLASGASE